MFIRQQAYKIMKRTIHRRLVIVLLLNCISSIVFAQAVSDSNTVLEKITLTSSKKQNVFAKPVPVQLLNEQTLQQLDTHSIGDAAKYFSGVLIKDYGGIGGLKTISVRSLGGANTGVLYDGIPVADAQSGQIDLSKFSSTFVQSLELDLANPQQMPLPARAYSSAAVLSIASNTFDPVNFTQKKWQLDFNQGSFGLWQPSGGIYLPVTKSFVVSVNAEATWNKGDYPYNVPNGMFSQKLDRTNSDIRSFQGEINTVKQFADSATLQTKIWGYFSERGLPGSIILYDSISVQRLTDNDFFVQSRYQAKLNTSTALLISAKYSNLYTRYQDPNFFNNTPGGLDDQYTEQEGYFSAALSKKAGKYITVAIASDAALTNLTANIKNFPAPTRTNLWNSITVQFAKSLWQINGCLLNTNNADRTAIGPSLQNKNEFTPTLATSYKLGFASPFLLRAFYKKTFRMPTFNDVYYNYISSIDPKLQPEYNNQYDLGIVYSKNYNSLITQLNIGVDGYYNSIRDKILAVPSANLFMWTITNIGKVDIRGVDVTAEINGAINPALHWSSRIAYTFQQAEDVTNPASNKYKNQIPYTPNNSGSGLVAMYYKNWDVSYSALFSGYRYTLGENEPSNKLPGWITQDISISKKIKLNSQQIDIKVSADNIFDQRYYVVNYYPMPSRSYKISILFNNL
jgi:vitamin B12 transporter